MGVLGFGLQGLGLKLSRIFVEKVSEGSCRGGSGIQQRLICSCLPLPTECRNLIKKPWVFVRVPYMSPTIWGVIGPGFLNQVPTLPLILCSWGPSWFGPGFLLATGGRRLIRDMYVFYVCVYIYIEIVGLGICFQSSDVEDTDALM